MGPTHAPGRPPMPQSKPPPLPPATDEDLDQSRKIVKTLEHNLKRRSRQHLHNQIKNRGERLGLFKRLGNNVFLIDGSTLDTPEDISTLPTTKVILLSTQTVEACSFDHLMPKHQFVHISEPNSASLFSKFNYSLKSCLQDKDPVSVVALEKDLDKACFLAFDMQFGAQFGTRTDAVSAVLEDQSSWIAIELAKYKTNLADSVGKSSLKFSSLLHSTQSPGLGIYGHYKTMIAAALVITGIIWLISSQRLMSSSHPCGTVS